MSDKTRYFWVTGVFTTAVLNLNTTTIHEVMCTCGMYFGHGKNPTHTEMELVLRDKDTQNGLGNATVWRCIGVHGFEISAADYTRVSAQSTSLYKKLGDGVSTLLTLS